MGKGSKSRVKDLVRYRREWERIFRKPWRDLTTFHGEAKRLRKSGGLDEEKSV